jgi:DNA polymerase-3 subunit epsilon
MDFVAIDVETANPNMASICQIGLVVCENGSLSQEWKTYVNPEDYFSGVNISIHGINESTVEGSPIFPEVSDTLHDFLENKVVVCHTHFDRTALYQSAQRYEVRAPACAWLDSAQVARRVWKECSSSGYGLSAVCQMLGYEFKHHDALEDAKAAAHIILAASDTSGIDLEEWVRNGSQVVYPPVGGSTSSANPEGVLFGEVLVFTGSLQIPRRDAAELAASIGCSVASGVTKKTTLLVVGDQDITKLAGHDISNKHRKALGYIDEGQEIRILKESDFAELVKQAEKE